MQLGLFFIPPSPQKKSFFLNLLLSSFPSLPLLFPSPTHTPLRLPLPQTELAIPTPAASSVLFPPSSSSLPTPIQFYTHCSALTPSGALPIGRHFLSTCPGTASNLAPSYHGTLPSLSVIHHLDDSVALSFFCSISRLAASASTKISSKRTTS
ncbi:hypothetical protein F4823DRAFT_253174 [Ustulina deusta]|nr:hypothetical protein F4823DRAFT_253174 [Ustulina deusta]